MHKRRRIIVKPWAYIKNRCSTEFCGGLLGDTLSNALIVYEDSTIVYTGVLVDGCLKGFSKLSFNMFFVSSNGISSNTQTP